MILKLFFIGWLSLVSSGDLLVFPGLNANKSCDINNKVKAGKCISYNKCSSETKEFCDLFEEVVYVCCDNSLIKADFADLRNSRASETG